jgi:hypothetical protein
MAWTCSINTYVRINCQACIRASFFVHSQPTCGMARVAFDVTGTMAPKAQATRRAFPSVRRSPTAVEAILRANGEEPILNLFLDVARTSRLR